jgi:chromosome segregation ATPase
MDDTKAETETQATDADALRAEWAEFKASLIPVVSERDELRAQLTAALSEKNAASEGLARAAAERDRLQEALVSAGARGAVLDQALESKSKELAAAMSERDELADELRDAGANLDTLRAIAGEDRTAAQRLTQRAIEAEMEAASFKASYLGVQEALVRTDAERVSIQNTVAAAVAERDAAVFDRNYRLAELADDEAKRWVDVLELPWDGTKALPGQLRAIMAELREARGQKS